MAELGGTAAALLRILFLGYVNASCSGDTSDARLFSPPLCSEITCYF